MNKASTVDSTSAEMTNDPRWLAVLERDSSADGQFFYSVKTTGVYCRPSCGSRLAKPENIAFHATATEAETAGFRPCKRCKPDQPSLAAQQSEMVTDLCKFIEQSEHIPSLKDLAERAGFSTYHIHRLFKAVTGVTPRAYAEAHRTSRVRSALQLDSTITEAIYTAGYHSGGRFYEKSAQILGMTPTSYRSGAINLKIRFAIGQCSLGAILVAASERGICAILLGDHADKLICDLQDHFHQAVLVGGDTDFEQWVAHVVGFVEAPNLGLKLPLDVQGTVFQQRVWATLCAIPIGKTVSYSDIAKQIGAPKSTRAVANACAANMLAVAIPCHRVVRTDGSLSGYRWGIERKRILLKREAEEK